MALTNPRLTEYNNINVNQSELDFAIPHIVEDLPLYVDPFLLYKSPSLQDRSLHKSLVDSFNFLGKQSLLGYQNDVAKTLIELSECSEAGLGSSSTKVGKKISESTALNILSLFKDIKEIATNGIDHLEIIQFFVTGISRDRISDLTCSLLKSFLIDFTIDNCEKYLIPMKKFENFRIFDSKTNKIVCESVELPYSPITEKPILFIPRRWLRFSTWINYEDYFDNYFIKDIDSKIERGEIGRIKVLSYNRENYGVVLEFMKRKELSQNDCINDPLFKQMPITSAKIHLKKIEALPTGKEGSADKKYEQLVVDLLASLFYPQLDFADDQVRTESGAQIRDLIFYNSRAMDFLFEIYNKYSSKQLVFEIKNVKELNKDHINQLNRYLSEELGHFGVIVTRNGLPKSVEKHIVDLWSGQRKCIIVITDQIIKEMVDVFETKQRLPIEFLKKEYILMTRKYPS